MELKFYARILQNENMDAAYVEVTTISKHAEYPDNSSRKPSSHAWHQLLPLNLILLF